MKNSKNIIIVIAVIFSMFCLFVATNAFAKSYFDGDTIYIEANGEIEIDLGPNGINFSDTRYIRDAFQNSMIDNGEAEFIDLFSVPSFTFWRYSITVSFSDSVLSTTTSCPPPNDFFAVLKFYEENMFFKKMVLTNNRDYDIVIPIEWFVNN